MHRLLSRATSISQCRRFSRGFIGAGASSPAPNPNLSDSLCSHGSPRPSGSEDTVSRLAQLGFSANAFRACSFPLPPDLPDRLQLLLSRGATASDVERMASHVGFSLLCSKPWAKIEEMIELVGAQTLLRTPEVLKLRSKNIKEKVKFYRELNVQFEKLSGSSFLFSSKLETLQRHVEELRALGLTDQGIAKIVQQHPYLLILDPEKCIKPAVALMESRTGLQGGALWKFIMFSPQCIGLSTGLLDRKFELFTQLGLDVRSSRTWYAFFHLFRYNVQNIMARISWLVACGMSWEVVVQIILTKPRVIACREETLNKKISYVLHNLKRDMTEIIGYPKILSLSLEKCIMPRFMVVSQLEEKGLLSNVSLSFVLSPSQARFNQKFKDKLKSDVSSDRLTTIP